MSLHISEPTYFAPLAFRSRKLGTHASRGLGSYRCGIVETETGETVDWTPLFTTPLAAQEEAQRILHRLQNSQPEPTKTTHVL